MVEGVRTVEKEQDEWRTREGRKVLGCNKLRAQSIRKPFTPKKRSPALPFIICSDNKERIAAIEAYKEFCRECDEAYHAWKIGDYTVEWPPGAFKPAMPPTVIYSGQTRATYIAKRLRSNPTWETKPRYRQKLLY